MISALYVALSALLIIWLSFYVVKIRRKHRISVGDGGNTELLTAMAAQSNAVEYIPIALLLLVTLEYNGGSIWLVHLFGVGLLVGRLIHARYLLIEKLKGRVLGMQITVLVIIALAVLNIVYLPFNKLSG